jgi:hypothetical protein
VTAKYELMLLGPSGERIYSNRDINIFSNSGDRTNIMKMYAASPELDPESSFHVSCDVTVVEVAPVKPLHR